MTRTDSQDPIDVALAGVTPLGLNRSHDDAVRRRCRSQFARRTVSSRRDVAGRSWTAVAMPVLLALFSAMYAVALLSTALRLEAWVP